MTKYFTNIKTLDELRKTYKELLKKYHPDNNKDIDTTPIIQEVNAEYDEVFKRLKDNRQHFTDEYEEQKENKKYDFQEDEKIRQALYNVIHFDGLNIEIIGCWIWIDGNTIPYKEELKKHGYTWSRNRKKWHYSPYETAKYYKGKKKTFEELRSKYGNETIKTEVNKIAQ